MGKKDLEEVVIYNNLIFIVSINRLGQHWSDTYYKGCLLRRNDFMLQHSNFVIAYYDGKQKGGTYYTCREARKRGMTVVNLF